MGLKDLRFILQIRGIKFIVAWLFKWTTIINIYGPIIRTRDQILIELRLRLITSCSRFLVFWILIHLKISLLFNLVNIGIFSHRWIFVHLSFAARDHNEVQSVHLSAVIASLFLYNWTFFEIPNDDSTVFGAGGQVSVAVTYLDVNDDIHVAMETGLEHHGIFPPDFDDSLDNKKIMIKELKKNLPIISSSNN